MHPDVPRFTNDKNDCGVLTAYAVAGLLQKITEFPDLHTMRVTIGKSEENGTTQGAIVKFLKGLGLSVRYFSEIDWQMIASLPREDLERYCQLANELLKEPSMLDPQAVKESADYLTSNRIPEKWNNPEQVIQTFFEALDNKQIIILLVHGSHSIALVGTEQFAFSDERNFIVYDPNLERFQSCGPEFLMQMWKQEVNIGAQVLKFRDAIFVSR